METDKLDTDIIETILKVIINKLANYEEQVTAQGRTIKYKAEGRVHSVREPWVYDGTAWDIWSGISEEAKHYQSKQGAVENALRKLLNRLKKEGLLELPSSKL